MNARQSCPGEPRQCGRRSLLQALFGLGLELVAVQVGLDRLAELLQRGQHLVEGRILLFAFRGRVQRAGGAAVSQASHPLGGDCPGLRIAGCKGLRQALLQVGQFGDGLLCAETVCFTWAERHFPKLAEKRRRRLRELREDTQCIIELTLPPITGHPIAGRRLKCLFQLIRLAQEEGPNRFRFPVERGKVTLQEATRKDIVGKAQRTDCFGQMGERDLGGVTAAVNLDTGDHPQVHPHVVLLRAANRVEHREETDCMD